MLNPHVRFLLAVWALAGAGLVSAQPVSHPTPQGDGPPQRTQLRSALRDARQEPSTQGDARRLSEQERAQLRQQLREGPRGSKRGQP
jgi:hypothetical protein